MQSGANEPDQARDENRHPDAVKCVAQCRRLPGIAVQFAADITKAIAVKLFEIRMVLHFAKPEQGKAKTNQNDGLGRCSNGSNSDGDAGDDHGDMPMAGIPDFLKVHAAHISKTEDGGTIVRLRDGLRYTPIMTHNSPGFNLGETVHVSGKVIGHARFADRDDLLLVKIGDANECWFAEKDVTPGSQGN